MSLPISLLRKTQKISNLLLDFDDGHFFYNDGMVMFFFFKAPLPSVVFQWFYHPWTITIECFFTDQPLTSMVFSNSGAMVSDGFDLEKNLKMLVIFLKDTKDHTATCKF